MGLIRYFSFCYFFIVVGYVQLSVLFRNDRDSVDLVPLLCSPHCEGAEKLIDRGDGDD